MNRFTSVQYNNAMLTLDVIASVSFGTYIKGRCVSENCRGKEGRTIFLVITFINQSALLIAWKRKSLK
jgi:hypothetical protein